MFLIFIYLKKWCTPALPLGLILKQFDFKNYIEKNQIIFKTETEAVSIFYNPFGCTETKFSS